MYPWPARILAGEPILDGEGILGGERTLCGERSLGGLVVSVPFVMSSF